MNGESIAPSPFVPFRIDNPMEMFRRGLGQKSGSSDQTHLPILFPGPVDRRQGPEDGGIFK